MFPTYESESGSVFASDERTMDHLICHLAGFRFAFVAQLPVPTLHSQGAQPKNRARVQRRCTQRGSAMACASAAAVAAVSSGVQVCEAGSRVSTSSVSLKASLGHVRCLSRALSLNESVRKVQMFGSRQAVSDVVRKPQPIRAQAVENDLATGKEPSSPATSQKTTYYYLIANAKFMLDDEEHFQEQMQEKLRMYGERNKEQDFWMVIEPEFLDKHPEVAKRVSRPAVALLSTDKVWITFMKLRLDRVLKGEITVDSPKEALAGKLTTVQFERPEKWIAPYPKYEGDWWTPFLYREN